MFPDMEDAEINSRLVGYCSDQVTIEKRRRMKEWMELF